MTEIVLVPVRRWELEDDTIFYRLTPYNLLEAAVPGTAWHACTPRNETVWLVRTGRKGDGPVSNAPRYDDISL